LPKTIKLYRPVKFLSFEISFVPSGRWYGDLYAQGVIDPAKVVRTALQDAASVAGLLVTTEAMIAEKPKKDAAPALPAGGGINF